MFVALLLEEPSVQQVEFNCVYLQCAQLARTKANLTKCQILGFCDSGYDGVISGFGAVYRVLIKSFYPL